MKKDIFDSIETPEAAALISFSRVSGNTNLFACPFRTTGYIEMKIKRCEVKRSTGHTWYFGREQYIEVAMSYSQFAEAITAMNMGDGVPCTMHTLQNKKFPPVPIENQRPLFEQEGIERIESCVDSVNETLAGLDELKMSAKDRKALQSMLESVKMQISQNLPFIAKSYGEHLNKVEQQAKTEIAAYMDMAIRQHGFDAIEGQKPLLLVEGSEDV
jgi:hypothetical protein